MGMFRNLLRLGLFAGFTVAAWSQAPVGPVKPPSLFTASTDTARVREIIATLRRNADGLEDCLTALQSPNTPAAEKASLATDLTKFLKALDTTPAKWLTDPNSRWRTPGLPVGTARPPRPVKPPKEHPQ
jgi:hypothetical protein